MFRYEFSHRVPRSDLALGLLVAHAVPPDAQPSGPLAALERWLAPSFASLQATGTREAARAAARDVLRNGSYKPTGRGKPASEYLFSAAQQGRFPRVNALVDAANLVSLAHLVPISLWDLELSGSRCFEFRLGAAGESYLFNPSGQSLELHDLVSGYALGGRVAQPIVTPVKDSMATKITPASRNVAACIYYPLSVGGATAASIATEELLGVLCSLGASVPGACGVCLPGQTLVLGDAT